MKAVTSLLLASAASASNFFSVNLAQQAQAKLEVVRDVTPTDYSNATITYDVKLPCESCVRGGYEYCIWRTFPTQTTHDQFTNCTDHPIIPHINSVTTVEETERWICASAFADQENGILNVCYPYLSNIRNPVCGNYYIDLTKTQSVQQLTIPELPAQGSCTYRVHTTCGYPAALYWSNTDITGQFDIAWSTQDGVTDEGALAYNFTLTSPQHGSQSTNPSQGNAHIFQDGLILTQD